MKEVYFLVKNHGRGERIWTSDTLLPNQVRRFPNLPITHRYDMYFKMLAFLSISFNRRYFVYQGPISVRSVYQIDYPVTSLNANEDWPIYAQIKWLAKSKT